MSEIMFPVGRMIGGSLYKAYPRQGTDGKDKIGKDGQVEKAFSFGVAILKGQEQHWMQTSWGQQIKQIAEAAYGAQTQHPSFAWKIIDGDSQIPNKKGKRPCDQDGYPGHWVLWFSQSWQPRICNANGTVALTEPDSVLPGYFIQVYGGVTANGTLAKPSQSPGVYLNPIAVALAAYGERIITNDVDTASVGFGGGTLPPGASMTPPATMQAPSQPLSPPVQPAVTPTIQPQAVGLAPPLQNQVVVAPNPAIFNTPVPPPAPAPSHQRVMLSAANGFTYEQLIATGWTDELLVQHGLMVA